MTTTQRQALVTGGAGFIGSHLVDRLVAEGWTVTVLDDLSSGHLENLESSRGNSLRFIQGSITDSNILDQALAGVTHVFHLAARPSVARSIETPFETNEINVSGTLRLLDKCRKIPSLERFVLTSSSSVYGNTPTLPKLEPMAGATLSPYALQKWTGESYLRLFHELYGLPGIALRPFNVFGPRQRSDNPYAAVIPLFLSAARANQPLVVNGDGQQTRDFTFVANMVEGFMRAGSTTNREALGKAFNIANAERTSILELAGQIIALTGSRSKCEHKPPRAGDIRDSFAGLELAKALLGYAPKITFSQGLRALVEATLKS
jgi:nucleoside-diphosphate-sugar epimerase